MPRARRILQTLAAAASALLALAFVVLWARSYATHESLSRDGPALLGLDSTQGQVTLSYMDRTVAVWPSLTLTMSVSSTFTSAVISEMSATVMIVLVGEFWMPGTTVSPTRTGRFVTTPSMGEYTLYLSKTSEARRRLACT